MSKRGLWILLLSFLIISSSVLYCFAQAEEGVSQEGGMSLWQLIKSGGSLMWLIGLCSFLTLVLIIQFSLTLRLPVMAPPEFVRSANRLLEEGDVEGCRRLCRRNPNFLALVLEAGLKKAKEDPASVKEAMEGEGRNEALALRQRIRYLSDIGVIAPMLGLLGTVLGMIKAFQVIAYKTEAVKPILLAGGISMALVTTAAGLIVGIPAMGFYFYFRAKAQRVISAVEEASAELGEKLIVKERGDR